MSTLNWRPPIRGKTAKLELTQESKISGWCSAGLPTYQTTVWSERGIFHVAQKCSAALFSVSAAFVPNVTGRHRADNSLYSVSAAAAPDEMERSSRGHLVCLSFWRRLAWMTEELMFRWASRLCGWMKACFRLQESVHHVLVDDIAFVVLGTDYSLKSHSSHHFKSASSGHLSMI